MNGEDAARPVRSEVVVYLPAQESPAMAGIARGSAIVGAPAGPGRIRIYYEDDPGGTVDAATFGKRVLIAYERLRNGRAPHKMRVVPRESLTAIGTYSRSQRRVTLVGRGSKAELAAWLGSKRLSPDQLQA